MLAAEVPSSSLSPSARERLEVGPVERTLVIPLWARAVETRKARPLVVDPAAARLHDELDFDFSVFKHAWGTQIGCVLRGLQFDAWTEGFLARHPEGTVVELGAGLGTRAMRIDNGRARFVDVDLPDVAAIRRRLMAPSARRSLLACSITDPRLVSAIAEVSSPPYLFVVEGVLMYLPEDDVRGLLVRLTDAFGPTEIALDAIGPLAVRHQALHDSMRHMRDAPFRWGIDKLAEIEAWDRRFCLEDAATLPEIASRFRSRVRRRHRLVGSVVSRALPWLARSYTLGRLTLGH